MLCNRVVHTIGLLILTLVILTTNTINTAKSNAIVQRNTLRNIPDPVPGYRDLMDFSIYVNVIAGEILWEHCVY